MTYGQGYPQRHHTPQGYQQAPVRPTPKQDSRGARITGRVAVIVLWLTTVVLAGGLILNNSIPGGGPFFQFLIVALVMILLGAAAWLTAGIAALIRRRMAWSLIVAPIVLVAGYFFAYSSLPEQLHWPVMRTVLENADNDCPSFAGLAHVESCTDVLGSTGYDFGGGGLDRVVIVQLDDAQHAQLGNSGDPKAANPGGWQEADNLGDGWYVLRMR